MNKFEVLEKYFGYKNFRKGQEEIIDSLINGRDALCVMPTGAGKSICYQIPALLNSGVTLVVSPLISLMKDQVNALCQVGVPAAFINSSLTQKQYYLVIERALNKRYKIIYIAPERLVVGEFLDLCSKLKIDMVAVDEAHCVSQWGQDFRPSYLKIIEFIEKLPYRPVISAFTATATKTVKDDIETILKLDNPLKITTGFDRPNLYFGVEKPKNKMLSLLDFIEKNKENCGIVYCLSRKSVEEVCEALCRANFLATRYHAGLSDLERKTNQEDFLYDKKTIMVATNAFGMGIDKSNVSYVIHYNMPKNIESYYQEAGRAGRDGSSAKCILFYSGMDVRTNLFLIDNSDQNPQLTDDEQRQIHEKDRERLKIMTYYCTASDCLRAYIIKYFGEKTDEYCGNCSNCKSGFTMSNITKESQIILTCVLKTGNRFGISTIIDVLRCSKNEKILRLGLDSQSTYGLLSTLSVKKIHSIIDFLITNGYASVTNSNFPILMLTELSKEILYNNKTIEMKVLKETKKTSSVQIATESNISLFADLKQLRNKIAKEEKVPAYIIFTDSTILDMCKKTPTTIEDFLNVSGVGLTKQRKYGQAFIDIINKYAILNSTNCFK